MFFLSCSSIADFSALVYDRIARAFNRPGVTLTVRLDILRAFHRVWYIDLLHNRKF